MSFILDALRKSERERQRNRGPDVTRAGTVAASRNRGLWLPLVAALVGLNVGLIAVVVWMIDSDRDEPAALPSVAATAPTRPVPQPVVRADGERSLQSQLETASPAPPPAAPERAPAAPAVTAPAPVAATEPDATDYPPTLDELILDGSLNLPPLRIDLHVYSAKPAERFVFINSARYREGERLSEGPAITEINELGVVMQYEGREFLLSRD